MRQGLFFILGVIFTLTIATRQGVKTDPSVKKSMAEVEQVQGLYIFSDSKPLREYKYLGTVKVTTGWSGQYQPLRDKLIKKGREDFKEADGMILHLVNMGTDKADLIKFID
jgi:hypothetical protein